MKSHISALLLAAVLLLSACSSVNAEQTEESAPSEIPASVIGDTVQEQERKALSALAALDRDSALEYRTATMVLYNAPKTVSYHLLASHQDGYSDYAASVYDTETQQGKYLCSKESCEHKDESCEAFVRLNRWGRYDTNLHTFFMNFESDTGLVMTGIDLNTGEKTETVLYSNENLYLGDLFFNGGGYAVDGDMLYVCAEYSQNNSYRIICINSATGEMNTIMLSEFKLEIASVSADALIVVRQLGRDIYSAKATNPNTPFEETIAVTKDGNGIKRLHIAPIGTETRFVDGKNGKIYYFDLNYYYDKEQKAYTPHCDGAVHCINMVTGEETVAAVAPVKWGEASVYGSEQGYLMMWAGDERYIVSLADGTSQPFTPPIPKGTSSAHTGEPIFYSDKAIVQNYATGKLYAISAKDYFAGKSAYTELAGSEIVKEY